MEILPIDTCNIVLTSSKQDVLKLNLRQTFCEKSESESECLRRPEHPRFWGARQRESLSF